MTTLQRVLIADDHEITRRGLRELLNDEYEGLEIVEASDASSVIERAREGTWDLILLDIRMPGPGVVDVIKTIHAHSEATPVLVVTALTETAYVVETMKAGASGVIHKHRAADDLVTAIRAVASGGTYMHPETATDLAAEMRKGGSSLPHHLLSKRELDVFRRIALGRTIKEIAGELDLSDKTVATYFGRIREKTGLSSYVDIARYAIRHTLVE